MPRDVERCDDGIERGDESAGHDVVAASAFLLLGWAASNDPPLDVRILELFSDLSGWIHTLSWIAFSGSGSVALLFVVLSLFDSVLGRGLLRDLFWSIIVSAVLGLGSALTVTGAWPEILPEFVASEGLRPYPTL